MIAVTKHQQYSDLVMNVPVSTLPARRCLAVNFAGQEILDGAGVAGRRLSRSEQSLQAVA